MNRVDHDILVSVNHKGRTADLVEVAELPLQLGVDFPEPPVELRPQLWEPLLPVHGLHRRTHPLRPLADVGHLVNHPHVLVGYVSVGTPHHQLVNRIRVPRREINRSLKIFSTEKYLRTRSNDLHLFTTVQKKILELRTMILIF